MKVYILLLGIICISCVLHSQERTTLMFNTDKFDLSLSSKNQLDHLIDSIKEKAGLTLEIHGHADEDGSAEYNYKLSRQRMTEVAKYLINHGIDSSIIATFYHGEQEPVTSDSTEKGKQQNRRVEIIITFARAPGEIKEPDLVVGNIYDEFPVESQMFKINPRVESSITGEQGTLIIIPPNSFELLNGYEGNDSVEIELREYYQKSDMLKSDLHTMSNGNLLETAGMIYISARYKKAELKLKAGSYIEILFPTKQADDDMKIFNGELVNGEINWILNEERDTNSEAERKKRWLVDINGVSTNKEQRQLEEEQRQARADSARKLNEIQSKKQKIEKTLLRSANLGWINCDIFINTGERTNLIVLSNPAYKPEFRLVFKDINSIMSGMLKVDGQISFNNIPIGQPVTLVGFAYVNGSPYYISRDIIIKADDSVIIELEESTFEVLEAKLKKLN